VRRKLLVATLAALSAVAGCNWPGKPGERPVEDFKWLYPTHCAGCHGEDGKDGPAPPLNDPLFLALITDKELRQVIVEGREGTPMTAFARDRGGPLTDKQIDKLIDDIKTRWKPASGPKKKPPAYLLSDARPGDSKRGRKVFARDCASCHGKDGKAGDKAGVINDPAFLTLLSDQLLRRYVITGRPDFKMPNYIDRDDEGLTSQEINDLVALLASWRVGSDNDK
jgi:cytochrome c oxidase cbb3-type subunit 3/ubiquinol-cytochrome c reductase cytochrome c subunit